MDFDGVPHNLVSKQLSPILVLTGGLQVHLTAAADANMAPDTIHASIERDIGSQRLCQLSFVSRWICKLSDDHLIFKIFGNKRILVLTVACRVGEAPLPWGRWNLKS